ncbi:MAG: hypothetical protein MHM6MM_002697 [Cercozoa sp. M6MM]
MPAKEFVLDDVFVDERLDALLADPLFRVTENVLTREDLWKALARHEALSQERIYNVKTNEVKPVTRQKSSGRCWIFAGLNQMRGGIAKNLGLDELELSQNYVYFYHLLESAHCWMRYIVERRQLFKESPQESRELDYLLKTPPRDAGQYDMFAALVLKYGVVPVKVYPDTHHSGASRRMRAMLHMRLRQAASVLCEKEDDTEAFIKSEMKWIFTFLCRCLGRPPRRFSISFDTKKNGIVNFDHVTPLGFAQQATVQRVETGATDVSNRHSVLDIVRDGVSLVHDPRHPRGMVMTVDCLHNIHNSDRPIRYVGGSISDLKLAALRQLQSGLPVWFGCDFGKFLCRELDLQDPNIFEWSLVDLSDGLFSCDKRERLLWRVSEMTHAMVLTGAHVETDPGTKEEKVTRWRVENSHGAKHVGKGFLNLSDEYFDECIFQIVVLRRFLPPELLEAYETREVFHLPPWDPMGALA